MARDGFAFRLWASYFLLLRQKKVTKEKATPHRCPAGSRFGVRRRAFHQLALARGTNRPVLRNSDTVPLFSRLHTPNRQR